MNQAALMNFIKELGQQLKRQVATSTMYDIPHVPGLKGTQHLVPCKETFFIFHFYFHIFFFMPSQLPSSFPNYIYISLSCLFIFHLLFHDSCTSLVHAEFIMPNFDTKIQDFPQFVALLTKPQPLFCIQKSRTKNFLTDLE